MTGSSLVAEDDGLVSSGGGGGGTNAQEEDVALRLSGFNDEALERELDRRRNLKPSREVATGGGCVDVPPSAGSTGISGGSGGCEDKGCVCVPCFEIA